MARKETEGMFRAPILYREWGRRFTKIEKYDMAIEAFEKSMQDSETDDLRTLLGLCQALESFTRYREAADIATKCMEIDPQNYMVKWMRVKTYFKIAEFGYSLIHAYRGYRQQKLPFEWAIYQANETIEDCVGRNTLSKALVELYPWIKQLEKHRESLIAKLNEEEDEFEGIDEEHSRFQVNDPEYRLEVHLRGLDRVMASRYLGNLATDKYFVEDLLENTALWSANKVGSRALRTLTKNCISRSRYRQEVLRMRKPLYFFRFQRRSRPEGHKIICRLEKHLRKNNIVIEADSLLKKLHATRIRRDYTLFFRYVDRTKHKFDSYTDSMFPMKKLCLDAIYRMVAWAYIDPRDVTRINDPEMKLLYLKHHLGIRVGALPRDTDLAWIPTLNKKEALRVFRRRLALASEPLELAWLFHELCKYFIETRRFDLARFYAKKARDSSYEARSEQWVLNCNHLMIRIEIYQHNRNEAKEAALLAYLGARNLGIDCLQDFYRRIVKLVDDIDLDKMMGVDSITAREQLIAELMPEELKTDVNFLLQSMKAVPAKRRLSVMPGCKPVDYKFNFPCKRNTILPNPPKNPEREARQELLKQYAPSKKVLGLIDFEDYE